MSASISPTRAPCLARATARFAVTVDFPTPPFPLEIATMLPKCGYATGVGAGTAARRDCGSCPITGRLRGPLLVLSAVGPAVAGREGAGAGRVETLLTCDASFTSTLTSVTPGTCCSACL